MPMNGATYTVTPWAITLYIASVLAFSFSAEDVLLSNLLGLCMVMVFGLESMTKKLFFFRVFTWPHFFFFWFVLLCAGSLMFAPEGYLRVRTLVLLFILTIIISNVVGRTGDLRPVIFGVLTGLGYAIFTGLEDAMSASSRVASTLSNANTYAVALLVGTLFCLYSILLPRVEKFRKTYFVFYFLCILVFGYQIIFLTGSRNGIFLLVFILAAAYVFFWWRLTGFLKHVSLIGGFVLGSLLVLILQLSPHYDRVQRAIDFSSGETVKEGSIYARAAMMQEGMDLWGEKPLLGWGTDQFRYISSFGTYSHNNYFELLVNQGLIGLIIYYSIYMCLIYRGIVLFLSRDMEDKKLGFWILLTTSAFLVSGVASVSYYSKIHWIVFASIFGLIAAEKNKKEKFAAIRGER
jgi:O-antigen ligase